MTTFICPCCNSTIQAPPDVSALRDVARGPVADFIMDALIKAYPGGMAADRLSRTVYDGRRAPDDPRKVVMITIHHLRKRQATHGWTIPKQATIGRGGVAFYKLQAVS